MGRDERKRDVGRERMNKENESRIRKECMYEATSL